MSLWTIHRKKCRFGGRKSSHHHRFGLLRVLVFFRKYITASLAATGYPKRALGSLGGLLGDVGHAFFGGENSLEFAEHACVRQPTEDGKLAISSPTIGRGTSTPPPKQITVLVVDLYRGNLLLAVVGAVRFLKMRFWCAEEVLPNAFGNLVMSRWFRFYYCKHIAKSPLHF